MDPDMEEVEIVFAQKLASGDPITRRRAFNSLRAWIADRNFTSEAMDRLCKGLHYAFWMQDKMLLHEKLADKIASLIRSFKDEQQSALFAQHLLLRLSLEWHRIDRWRMDKFLMLVRRLLRTIFKYLTSVQWNMSSVDVYMNAFKKCVLSPVGGCCDSVKSHFASVFLDELDVAGGTSIDQTMDMLKPFVQLLGNRTVSSFHFESVIDEIFMTILHDYAEQRSSKIHIGERNDESDEETKNSKKAHHLSKPIEFDYGAIAELIVKSGSNPSLNSKRRSSLYKVARKFMLADAGKEVFAQPVPLKDLRKPAITEAEINRAVQRLLALDNKHRSSKRKESNGKSRKKQKETEFNPDLEGMVENEEGDQKCGSAMKRKKNGRRPLSHKRSKNELSL